jgi:hypothetical protein
LDRCSGSFFVAGLINIGDEVEEEARGIRIMSPESTFRRLSEQRPVFYRSFNPHIFDWFDVVITFVLESWLRRHRSSIRVLSRCLCNRKPASTLLASG